MTENNKLYKTIGEVAKILDLVDKKTGKLSTHTLRYWEKEFKEVKPHIFSGNRRYYDNNSIEILKKIQFLLKSKGMTIKGVKKELKLINSDLDGYDIKTIKKKFLKKKLNKISSIINNLKSNGKKNTRQSKIGTRRKT